MQNMAPTAEAVVSPHLAAIEQAIEVASPSQCVDLVGKLERLKALICLRMMRGHAVPLVTASSELPAYLSVTEVAARFHVTPKWLYRHKKQMPHSQPSRKVLLFPEKATERWFASRKAS